MARGKKGVNPFAVKGTPSAPSAFGKSTFGKGAKKRKADTVTPKGVVGMKGLPKKGGRKR